MSNETIAVEGSDADRVAALELASKDPLLMKDEFTAEVISSGGKLKDGRIIDDIGNFLAGRKKVLEGDPDLSFGPKPKWNDLPPDVRGTSHDE